MKRFSRQDRGGLKSRRGFTMIEVMLVVVIGLLTAVVAVPSFIRSMRTAQLRTAVRTVVMTNKYARSMAVLKQQQMSVFFDREAGTLEVVSLADPRAAAQRSAFLDGRSGGDGTAEGEGLSIESETFRRLGDAVRISAFESSRPDQEVKGIAFVNYFQNGMCDGFEIELSDQRHKTARISVESISGKVKVEYR